MYLNVTNAEVSILDKTILESVNLEIKDKDRIAIIGRNGAGKTTLLKALIDNSLFEPGVGEEKFNIFKSGKFEIGYLNQNNKINEDNTLEEELLSVYASILKLEDKKNKLESKLEIGATPSEIEEYELVLEQYKNEGGYTYKKEYLTAITKFGFNEADLKKQIKNFSGGEKTKLAFLKLLLSKPDLLLLDEPTNHLDIEAIIWLEEYLKKYPKSFIIVSHDRMFINEVSNKIIEIEYGETEIYHGNYEYYQKEKKNRFERLLKEYESQQKEIARLQSIADRFRYKPSKASMAMSKLKQIERMEKLSPPERENLRTFNYHFNNVKQSGKVVLAVDNLASGYDKVLNTCSFELTKGRKLGIIGENGMGKSTLLKTIMSKIPPISGNFTFGHNVEASYFDQELNNLDEDKTIYEEYASKFPNLNNFEIRKNLGAFLFKETDLEKKINVLSGGEKVRLELCEVITKEPNLLILDEPTNHLDIVSKNRLESILESFPGTILFVSHDRYFVDKIADSLLVFENNEVKYYDLTYHEFIEKTKENNKIEPVSKITRETKNKPPKTTNNSSKESKKIETEINKKENKIKELKDSLFNPDIYSDYNKVNEINKQIETLETEVLELLTKLDV